MIDAEILEKLREMKKLNTSPVEMLHFLKDNNTSPATGLLAMRYVMHAFNLSIMETNIIPFWSGYGREAPDEDINRILSEGIYKRP